MIRQFENTRFTDEIQQVNNNQLINKGKDREGPKKGMKGPAT